MHDDEDRDSAKRRRTHTHAHMHARISARCCIEHSICSDETHMQKHMSASTEHTKKIKHTCVCNIHTEHTCLHTQSKVTVETGTVQYVRRKTVTTQTQDSTSQMRTQNTKRNQGLYYDHIMQHTKHMRPHTHRTDTQKTDIQVHTQNTKREEQGRTTIAQTEQSTQTYRNASRCACLCVRRRSASLSLACLL